MDFAITVEYGVKIKESEKIDKYLNFERDLKKLEHEFNNDTNCSWYVCKSPKGLEEKLEELVIRRRIERI